MLSAFPPWVCDMLLLWHRKDGQGTLRNWTLTLVLTGCCPVPQPCSASSASAAKALEQGAQEAAWLEPLEETFKLVSFPERRQVWIPPQLQAHCITVAFVGDTTICMLVGAPQPRVQTWQVGHRTPLGKAAGTIIMRIGTMVWTKGRGELPGCSQCIPPQAPLRPPSGRPVIVERVALTCERCPVCDPFAQKLEAIPLRRTWNSVWNASAASLMHYLHVPHGAQAAGRVVQRCLPLLVACLPRLVPAADGHIIVLICSSISHCP